MVGVATRTEPLKNLPRFLLRFLLLVLLFKYCTLKEGHFVVVRSNLSKEDDVGEMFHLAKHHKYFSTHRECTCVFSAV